MKIDLEFLENGNITFQIDSPKNVWERKKLEKLSEKISGAKFFTKILTKVCENDKITALKVVLSSKNKGR